jgi:DNA-binding beta-propeller fold protein YncE
MGKALPTFATVAALAASTTMLAAFVTSPPALANDVPQFQPEPFWPKPLPEYWILGQVSGIAVDRNDHIWLVHRPATLLDDEKGAQANPPATKCCKAAPAVMKFDAEGNLLASWGGPGQGYDWPKSEHGIHVDADGNVWVAGNDRGDSQILKFTPDGKFLAQIGRPGAATASNATDQLGSPAHMVTDDAAGELYVADGYRNRRVIVFDTKTGAYKRHWGAYGKQPGPDDKLPAYTPAAAPSQTFGNPVHCVRIANDGLVYVCDRVNDRIQVFRKDGAFVKEFRVEPQTLQNGSVWDLVLSTDPQQSFVFIADGANGQIHTLSREDGKLLSQWGRHGRQPGQFKWVHNIAIDSKGNLYTAEVGFGRRVQKFRNLGPVTR